MDKLLAFLGTNGKGGFVLRAQKNKFFEQVVYTP
jgi:hypothetical protein